MNNMFPFRFFISGKKDNLYGIKDIDDCMTEYFTESCVLKMSESLNVKGVVDGKIDLEWFKGYFAKEWTLRKSDILFALQFGLFITNIDGKLCRVPVLTDDSDSVDIRFIEYVQTLRCVAKISGGRILILKRTDSVKIMNVCTKIHKGVGFRYLTDNWIGYFDLRLLNKVNFDDFASNSSALIVDMRSVKNTIFSGVIHTSRNIKFNCQGTVPLVVGKCESTGGIVTCHSNTVQELKVLNSYAESRNVYMYFDNYEYVVVESESLLKYFTYGHYETFRIYYKVGLKEVFKKCIYIINCDTAIKILQDEMFIFCDLSCPSHILVSNWVYNSLICDDNFEERHGIELEEFKKLCQIF